MSKRKKPKPPAETPFSRFENALKKLLKVPKKEVDEKVAEERAKAAKKRRKSQ